LDDYITQGGRSFQGWLATVKVQELPLSDRTVLFNCNSPEDLANLPHN
jgi:molybdopterin-guanine dinucleotide biosynthesis protein A